MRVSFAANAEPSVMAGRIKCQIVPCPDTGSQFNCTEKRRISSGPSQKWGMEMPNNAMKVALLSSHEYCLRAEITPSGMAISSAIESEASVNSTVAGRRLIIVAKIGCPVKIDVPKSAVSKPCKKWAYCSMSGLFSPN